MRSFLLTLALLASIGTAEAQQASQSEPPSPGSMLFGATVAVRPPPADVLASDAYKVLIADLRQGGYVIYLRHAMTATTSEPAVGDPPIVHGSATSATADGARPRRSAAG